MILTIYTINDVKQLRYDIVRAYDNPDFNGNLKAFVVEQLDDIINGTSTIHNFRSTYNKITKQYC